MSPIPSLLKEFPIGRYLKSYLVLIQERFGSEHVKRWAQAIGITSRITFKHILRGKQNLNSNQMDSLQKALDFGHQERVLLKQSTVPAHNDKVVDKFFVSEEFFQTPINTIVLNLCGLKTSLKSEDIKLALNGLFTESAIDQTIINLLELKLIAMSGDKSLTRIFHGKITTIPGVKSQFSRDYFKHTHNLVDRAWATPLHLREIHAFTVPMDSKNIPQLKDLIRKLREDIYKLSSTSENDSVYQCSLSSVPVQTPELKSFWTQSNLQ